jgi:hypothetical protein
MEIPRTWRLNAQRYRMKGSLCLTCGQPTFPPRIACHQCMSHSIQTVDDVPSVLLTPTGPADIESHVRYQLIERVIG